jgi:hypothetical protein
MPRRVALLSRHFRVLVPIEAGPDEIFHFTGDYRRLTPPVFSLPGHVFALAVPGDGVSGYAKSPRYLSLGEPLFNRHFPDMLVLVHPNHHPFPPPSCFSLVCMIGGISVGVAHFYVSANTFLAQFYVSVYKLRVASETLATTEL